MSKAEQLRQVILRSKFLEVVMSAAFSPDGTRVVTASEDHTARVWDAVTGNRLIKD